MATLTLCSTAGRVAADESRDASGPPPVATASPIDRAGTGVHSYVAVSPERKLDTRMGIGAPAGKVAGGGWIELDVTGGEAAVPGDALAVVLNLTATEPERSGYVTVWPCGTPQPQASNLNYVAGQNIPNLVIAKVGVNGKVCVSTLATTHLLADLNGYFPAGSPFVGVNPERRLDSRTGVGTYAGILGPGGTVELDVTGGQAGVPANASAVVLNVTVTEPVHNGYVTVWPCGTPQPQASNLNYSTGQSIPNLVIAKVGANGKVCLSTLVPAHLLADINGYFPAGAPYVGVIPERKLDTRVGVGAPAGKLAPGGTIQLAVTGGASGVPANASAVVLNVTVTEPEGAGYVVVWPCDAPVPQASNLNYVSRENIPNLVIAKVAPDGTVCLGTYHATHVLADINGYFPPLPPIPPTSETTQPPALVATGGAGTVARDAIVDESAARNSAAGDPTPIAAVAPGDAPTEPPTQADLDAAMDDATLVPPATGQHRGVVEGAAGDVEARALGTHEPTLPITNAGFASSVHPAIGRLILWDYRDGKWYAGSSCSGTVVQRTLVLTAAHCIFQHEDPTNPVFWDGIQFIAGLNATTYHSSWFELSTKASYFPDYLRTDYDHWLYDFSLIRFDDVQGGKQLGDYTGSFAVHMGLARANVDKTTIGYPSEGWFGQYCTHATCRPYVCSSNYTSAPVLDPARDWRQVGWGCNATGGMSGSGVFSYYQGTWYVTSVTSLLGTIYDRNGNVTTDRTQAWWFQNGWGPELKQGWFDTLYAYAGNL